MKKRLPWKDCPEYKRLLEILKEYWLSEPDEAEVTIRMTFKKQDGQEQEKVIHWMNPDEGGRAS